jgi:hypothetical protein
VPNLVAMPVSKALAAAIALVMLIVGLGAGYYLANQSPVTSRSQSSSSSQISSISSGQVTSTQTSSSQTSSSHTSSQQLPQTEGSSNYSLSQRERVWLGWTLVGSYGVNSAVADSLVLIAKNIGQDSLLNLTYSIPYILGPVQNLSSVSAGASEISRVTFVGLDCGMTNVNFCSPQNEVTIQVHFSDGETFSIPQKMDVEWGAGADPFVYNINSPFCSGLLSTVGDSYTAGLANGYLTVSGSPSLHVAALMIFDPLDASGLRVKVVGPFTTGSGSFISIGSPEFISGKSYSLWLQIGTPSPTSSSNYNVYAPGGFCTVSISFVPVST